jgi:hypothetical protein
VGVCKDVVVRVNKYGQRTRDLFKQVVRSLVSDCYSGFVGFALENVQEEERFVGICETCK